MQKIKEMLKRYEGTGPIRDGRFLPYVDTVGKTTIGYGRNLTDRGLSFDEVEFLLEADLRSVREDLDLKLGWWKEHPENVQLVLQDLCFNMGIKTLLTFVRTLDLIQEKRYTAAADNLLRSKYAAQVHGRATRNAELLRTA